MLDKAAFLHNYNFEEKDLTDHNINWDTLIEIFNDFNGKSAAYSIHAEYISKILRTNGNIHTVRSRVKDPEHLVAKLIRKTPDRQILKNDPNFQFSIDNYRDEITDLIGIRAIHIFKEDWEAINTFIDNTWKVTEVTANIREGDDKTQYELLGAKIESRISGYRSVHYLVELNLTKESIVLAEIQVRTIFEEGYGEIDHLLRYPHTKVPKILEDNILLLNRIAGSADEMASFINILKRDWFSMMGNYEEIIDTKNKEIEELTRKIELTEMKAPDKKSLLEIVGNIKKHNTNNPYNTSDLGVLGNSFFTIGEHSRKLVNRHEEAIKQLADTALHVVNKHDQAIKSLQKSLDNS